MGRQLPSNPSNKKISDLIGMIRREELVLQPEFQRKLVWTKIHKGAFIETILMGYPFPEIYIAQSGIDLVKQQAQQVVVDGQQRLSTIMQYVEGEENNKNFNDNLKKYKDLSDDEKTNFLNYNVVVRDLADVESGVIREIFRRINQTKFNLTPVEIQNAVYDGEFISTAKKIQGFITLKHLPIFNESELSRMADLHFLLLIMSTIEFNGYFSHTKKIEESIIRYNNEYPNQELLKGKLLNVLDFIQEMDLPTDSIWHGKSNFFTLVVELYKNNDELNIDQIKNKLMDFERNILQNKNELVENNVFSKYYKNMFTGTNSRKARIERGDIFKEHILIR